MKTKKLFTVGLLLGIMTLAACGPQHTHVADDVWHKNDTKHWHECTSGDGFVMDEADHVYGNVSYVWDNDHKCKAVKECTVCEYKLTVQEVQGVYVKDTDATCLTNEKGHYSAHFTVEGLVDQNTERNGVELPDTATGHEFGGIVTYTWVEDECTASWGCVHEGCEEKQTEKVKGVYAKDTDATCVSNEKGHYVATFSVEGFEQQQTAKDSVEVPGTMLDHTLIPVAGQEPTAEADGWKDYFQCDSCKKLFEDEDGETEITDLAAWKIGNGIRYKTGNFVVPVDSEANWTVEAKSPAKVVWGNGVGSHPNAAQFKTYQWADWKEEELGIVATFDAPDAKISVNSLSYVFYYYPDGGSSGFTKADLTIKTSIIDNLGNKVLVDTCNITKDQTYSPWTAVSAKFDAINFSKLVIETETEFLDLPDNTGFNNIVYIDNLSLKFVGQYPTGTVNVSTTEGTNWAWSSKEGPVKVEFGVKPDRTTGGDYMCFRNYYYTGWKESQTGIEATYTIPEADIKKVNTLAFTAYMYNPNTDCNTTIKVIDVEGAEHLVVTKAYNINAVTPESFTFDECAVEKIVITTKAFVQDATGEANLFLKFFTLSYTAE